MDACGLHHSDACQSHDRPNGTRNSMAARKTVRPSGTSIPSHRIEGALRRSPSDRPEEATKIVQSKMTVDVSNENAIYHKLCKG